MGYESNHEKTLNQWHALLLNKPKAQLLRKWCYSAPIQDISWEAGLRWLHTLRLEKRSINSRATFSSLLRCSIHLFSVYNEHSTTKCVSSPIVLQLSHNPLFRRVLGFVCLPHSISRRWELDRILVNAFRYLNYLTKSKYGSKWKSLFSLLYNSNLGCIFEFRSLEPQPATNFSLSVIFYIVSMQVRLVDVATVLLGYLSDFTDPHSEALVM